MNSDFPLVPSDFLVASGAVFGGMRDGDGEGCVSEVSGYREEDVFNRSPSLFLVPLQSRGRRKQLARWAENQ